MITTVVFDMDDTLYAEIDYCKSGFAAVAEFIAKSPDFSTSAAPEAIFECLWSQFNSGNRQRTFNAALDQLGIDYGDQDVLGLVKVYREHIPQISLPEDSRRILDALKTKYRLAMLSDGFLPAQRLKVEALGIEKYFECIVYTEALGREFWKPHTKGFEFILKELDQKAENCVYIGDNPKKDFIGPNSLGFVTIELALPSRVHSTENDLGAGAKANHQISSIEQLAGLLERV